MFKLFPLHRAVYLEIFRFIAICNRNLRVETYSLQRSVLGPALLNMKFTDSFQNSCAAVVIYNVKIFILKCFVTIFCMTF